MPICKQYLLEANGAKAFGFIPQASETRNHARHVPSPEVECDQSIPCNRSRGAAAFRVALRIGLQVILPPL